MASETQPVGGDLMEFLSDFRAPMPAEPHLPPTVSAPPPRPRTQGPATPTAVPVFVPASDASLRRRPPDRRPRLTFAVVKDMVLNPTENRMATTALCLGLASIFLPVLGLGAIVLAVANLQRAARRPWLRGHARSYGAILASVILGPISLIVWLPLVGT